MCIRLPLQQQNQRLRWCEEEYCCVDEGSLRTKNLDTETRKAAGATSALVRQIQDHLHSMPLEAGQTDEQASVSGANLRLAPKQKKFLRGVLGPHNP